ncbi:uncharacterized protein B0T15DRAFT_186659 [Chaetomium strumarium]|uniref:Uncharacterized protein n=1 Tax=Chaetomium strumarium TaxID=1170767 RepID=A0AAJ0GSC4_9PEZI|nr:hypothetical protein B0T15DRAFT_186659 [Chaetomium strumarium]
MSVISSTCRHSLSGRSRSALLVCFYPVQHATKPAIRRTKCTASSAFHRTLGFLQKSRSVTTGLSATSTCVRLSGSGKKIKHLISLAEHTPSDCYTRNSGLTCLLGPLNSRCRAVISPLSIACSLSAPKAGKRRLARSNLLGTPLPPAASSTSTHKTITVTGFQVDEIGCIEDRIKDIVPDYTSEAMTRICKRICWDQPDQEFESELEHFWRAYLGPEPAQASSWAVAEVDAMPRRLLDLKCFKTAQHKLIGMTDAAVGVGDVVCGLFGLRVPVILRKNSDTTGPNTADVRSPQERRLFRSSKWDRWPPTCTAPALRPRVRR